MRRWICTIAALALLLALSALPARANVGAGDGGTGAPDAGLGADAAIVIGGFDAGADAPPDAPAPTELARPPELSSATLSSTPALIGTPSPEETEPPRPITRRLWFWMVVSGAIVTAVLVGIAVRNPNVTKPECPSGYVCP